MSSVTNAAIPAATTPVIFGCSGHVLDDAEKQFFKSVLPAGFILFKKNCDTPQQVTALVNELRACVGWHAPVLIDQEGGRVQRLRPPHWPDFPAQRGFGNIYEGAPEEATRQLQACVKGLAQAQCPMGIDVNCIPVLDVVPQGIETRAIDDRALSSNPQIVAALGVESIKAAIHAGMTPVMKHIPGHGRATVDSHFELPRVSATANELAGYDWVPFKAAASAVNNNTLWGMTAHVIYTALDPVLPATLSPTVIGNVIRGEIGFDGLLLSDDLFMEALAPWGNTAERTALAIKAGCDLALFCHGSVDERAAAAKAAGQMGAKTRDRLEKWHKTRRL